MKKVIVLMSTYNGEKYLANQLDSILQQSYDNLQIMIRDDGSSDDTVNILKQYEHDEKVTVFYGNNLGFVKSFFWLVDNCAEADYYSFSDQDDVWCNNKIELAVKHLDNYDIDSMNLYFSGYDFYDDNMNYIGKGLEYEYPFNPLNAMVNGETALGFTIVINRKLLNIAREKKPDLNVLYGHDHWFYLIALLLGNVCYNGEVTAKYRRHNNNVSTYGLGFIKHQLWRIKSFILNNNAQKISKTLKEFKINYYNELSETDKKLVDIFCYQKYNMTNVFKRLFFSKRLRKSIFDEFALRLIFLIGKY